MRKRWIIGVIVIFAAVIALSLAGGIIDTNTGTGSTDTVSETAASSGADPESITDDGTEGSSENSAVTGSETEAEERVTFAQTQSLDDQHLRDNDGLYENQDDDGVVTMYLTVSTGNEDEGTNHTWSQINQYSVFDYEEMGVARYKVEGLLQVGDENGPVSGEFGADEVIPNATVQIRGQSSSKNEQKNYKIRIKKNHGKYNNQRTIALNKHQSEGLRFRNKMGFDMLRKIPQLMSLRTQFVHLYVRDLTKGGSGKFEDYGLYTQVEQLNKSALESHGLDRNGQLYKVNKFEFYRDEDVIKLATDSDYDKDAFEEELEIKGSEDHSKLIEMLDALNDYSIPIEEIVDEYFDIENLSYWMAFNILIGNIDTENRNMFLYSPLNGNIWYLLCWDLDGSTTYDEERLTPYGHNYESWHRGISNYWGNVLFRRCLTSEEFRNALDDAVDNIRTNYLPEDTVREMVEEYSSVVKPFAYVMPDAEHEPLTSEQYDEVADGLPELIDFYYDNYVESLKKPMPFYIGTPESGDDGTVLSWGASFDLDNEKLTYTAVLASDPLLNDVITTYTGEYVSTTVPTLDEGEYYLKVSVTNSSGETQDAFDIVRLSDDFTRIFGEIHFYVMEDGSIVRE